MRERWLALRMSLPMFARDYGVDVGLPETGSGLGRGTEMPGGGRDAHVRAFASEHVCMCLSVA